MSIMRLIKTWIGPGVPEITVHEVHRELHDVLIVDVRTQAEFNSELGHIAGAKLLTLGPELTQWLGQGDKSAKIVFVCRSGGRSACAAAESIELGYTSVLNMTGGMLEWNRRGYSVERDNAKC